VTPRDAEQALGAACDELDRLLGLLAREQEELLRPAPERLAEIVEEKQRSLNMLHTYSTVVAAVGSATPFSNALRALRERFEQHAARAAAMNVANATLLRIRSNLGAERLRALGRAPAAPTYGPGGAMLAG
jgi:hypothetical protein